MFEMSEGREKGKSGSRFGPLVVFGAHTYAKLSDFLSGVCTQMDGLPNHRNALAPRNMSLGQVACC